MTLAYRCVRLGSRHRRITARISAGALNRSVRPEKDVLPEVRCRTTACTRRRNARD